MFVLQLNDMRSSNIEILTPVLRAESREILVELLESETTERYQDGRWGKCFKKDGRLEWFNPPSGTAGEEELVDVGTKEEWMEKAALEYETLILPIPEL